MANVFPILSSGSMTVHGTLGSNALMMYPASFGNTYLTRKIHFMNDTEQRWTVRNALFSAVLEFRSLSGYDASLLYEFFRQMRGAYVDPTLLNTFSITVSGVIYDYCVFDQDSFEETVDRQENLATLIRVKQLRPN